MLKGKTFLCIIAARGGSKGIKGKNIYPVAGKPMISYIADAIEEAEFFDDCILTTDSKEIAAVVLSRNITTRLRPAELATDTAAIADVVVDVLENVKHYDYVCLTSPCTPLLIGKDFFNAAVKLVDADADMCVSVTECPSPYTGLICGKDNEMSGFGQYYGMRRQYFRKQYYLNNGIYMGKWKVFENKENYYTQLKTLAAIIPRERSVDIDTAADIIFAEHLLRGAENGK